MGKTRSLCTHPKRIRPKKHCLYNKETIFVVGHLFQARLRYWFLKNEGRKSLYNCEKCPLIHKSFFAAMLLKDRVKGGQMPNLNGQIDWLTDF